MFALGHLGQTGLSVTMLTFILSGVVLGIVYLFSGDLALVIGAHATYNITSNILFNRGGEAGDGLSVLMRVEVEPSLTMLRSGGVLEAVAFLLLGLFALMWLRHSRGALGVDLDALHLDHEPDGPGSTPGPRPTPTAMPTTTPPPPGQVRAELPHGGPVVNVRDDQVG